jgi:hypothetical protein
MWPGALKNCYICDMKKVSPKQYTIKGIPGHVNLFLQEKARQEKKTLNQVIIECLEYSLAINRQHTGQTGSPDARDNWVTDARLEQEAAYLDILDADPSI